MRYENLAVDSAEDDYSYTTEDEKDYIFNLGSWGEKPKSKKSLLEKYIFYANRRIYWGEIDANECLKYAISQWKAYYS